MDVVTGTALGILTVAAVLALARVARPGSTLTDRVIGLDVLLATVVAGFAVLAARRGDDLYLDVVVAAALLGFLTTVAVARFMERRGAR